MNTSPITARALGFVSCHDCRLLLAKLPANPRCPRCGAVVHPRKPNSIARTWALICAALILYIPANTLPITITATLGTKQLDTIISGVIYFMQSGSWAIASIIFIASVFVPLAKLFLLICILLSVHFRSTWRARDRTVLYRLTEMVGRWSMVDIYVVTILIALVKLGAVASVEAGPAAVYFASVVVLTMFAAESFDPRLIWDYIEDAP